MIFVLSCLKKSLNTDLELFVEFTNDLIGTWIVKIDRSLSVVQLGGRIDRSNVKCADRGILDFLKEIGLLTSENSHAVDLVHQENAISASAKHHTLLVDRADDNKLVEDTDYWDVVSGPAELTGVDLLSLFIVKNACHVG